MQTLLSKFGKIGFVPCPITCPIYKIRKDKSFKTFVFFYCVCIFKNFCSLTSSTVLSVWLFCFLKLTHCRGFGGRKCNFTPKTDLLIFTHYLLTPVGYFPIIVRKFLKHFFGYRTLFLVRYVFSVMLKYIIFHYQ